MERFGGWFGSYEQLALGGTYIVPGTMVEDEEKLKVLNVLLMMW